MRSRSRGGRSNRESARQDRTPDLHPASSAESPLAVQIPMAGPHVAAGLGEQRNDVGSQSGRSDPCYPLDAELDLRVTYLPGSRAATPAVGPGRDEPVRSHLGDRGGLDAELAKAGHVAEGAVRFPKSHGDLLPRQRPMRSMLRGSTSSPCRADLVCARPSRLSCKDKAKTPISAVGAHPVGPVRPRHLAKRSRARLTPRRRPGIAPGRTSFNWIGQTDRRVKGMLNHSTRRERSPGPNRTEAAGSKLRRPIERGRGRACGRPKSAGRANHCSKQCYTKCEAPLLGDAGLAVPLSAPPYSGEIEEAARNITQVSVSGRRCTCLQVWNGCWASGLIT